MTTPTRAPGVDLTPAEGSFLWHCLNTLPHASVEVDNYRGRAGAVARDVRQMLAEIDRLRTELDRWQTVALKLADTATTTPEAGQ